MSAILLGLSILWCLVHIEQSDTIVNGNFKECIVKSNMLHLDYDKLCFMNSEINSSLVTIYNTTNEAIVLAKHNYVMEGIGYECSMKITTHVYETDIMFTQHDDSSDEYYQLSRLECYNMIESNKCGPNEMNCSNIDHCYYKQKTTNVKKPIWWGTSTAQLFECRYNKRVVMALNKNEKVFQNSISSCRAEDLYCQFDTSIVVWQTDVLRTCQFERILYVNDLMNIPPDTNIYLAQNEHYLFKLNGEIINACDDLTFFATHEGVYLSFIHDQIDLKHLNNLKESKTASLHLQSADYRKLDLLEKDYVTFEMIELLSKLACSSMLNTIRNNLHRHDDFIIINEMGYNELIIYINNDLAYIPQCRSISQITILTETKKCYKNIPITYTRNDSIFSSLIGHNQVSAFLRPQGIITQYSTLTPCENIDNKNMVIDEASIMLKRNMSKIIVENYTTSLKTQLKVSHSKQVLSYFFVHNEILLNESSIIETLSDIVQFKEGSSFFFVEKDQRSNSIEDSSVRRDGWFVKLAEVYETVKETIVYVYDNTKNYIFFTFVFAVVITIIIVVSKYCKCNKNCFKCNKDCFKCNKQYFSQYKNYICCKKLKCNRRKKSSTSTSVSDNCRYENVHLPEII